MVDFYRFILPLISTFIDANSNSYIGILIQFLNSYSSFHNLRQIIDTNETYSIDIFVKVFNLLYNLGIVVLNVLNILVRLLIFILKLIDQIVILIFNLFTIINELMKKLCNKQVHKEPSQISIINKQKLKTESITPKYECSENGKIVSLLIRNNILLKNFNN